MSQESEKYAALGVSSSKAGILAALKAPAQAEFFAEPCEDFAKDPRYYSFLHADGAGTKSIVAYLAYRESGDSKWFRGLAQDSLVMNLDDLACVGAFAGLALSNTIGRNRFLIADEIIGELVDAYRQTTDRLATVGIEITLSGGETADIGDLVRTLVVDSTLFGRVLKDQVLRTSRISAGDIIVGLSGTGQATYEDAENSSIGSNGLTLARHALLKADYAVKYPEIADPVRLPEAAGQGRYQLFERPPQMQQSIAEALLSPTRAYAPVVKAILEHCGSAVHAAIHCSGGGQTKILRFGSKKHYIKDQLFPIPPLFQEIQRAAAIPWQEMYAAFNMGHRMELICEATALSAIQEISQSFNIAAQPIGRVADSPDANRLSITSAVGAFSYSAARS